MTSRHLHQQYLHHQSKGILLVIQCVQAMLTLVFMFMLLDHASIRAIFNLVLEIVMIYILVLIWKLPNYLT